jgi:hypothetical protein
MNSWIYLIIESAAACLLFTALIASSLLKDPISYIASYPPAIRERVASLPEYAGVYKKRTRKQIISKIIAAAIMAVGLGFAAYFSGAKSFIHAFVHVFILFFVVNLYDVLILDIAFFCRSKRVVIKGTEDMTEEYKNPKHHIYGGLKGVAIGTVVALAAACVAAIIDLAA